MGILAQAIAFTRSYVLEIHLLFQYAMQYIVCAVTVFNLSIQHM